MPLTCNFKKPSLIDPFYIMKTLPRYKHVVHIWMPDQWLVPQTSLTIFGIIILFTIQTLHYELQMILNISNKVLVT